MTGRPPLVGLEQLAHALDNLALDAQRIARATRTCRCGHGIGSHDLDRHGTRTSCSTWSPAPCPCQTYTPALDLDVDQAVDQAGQHPPERAPTHRRTADQP